MRLLLSIFSVMLMVHSANAQSLWRNFFTTNRNPIVEVVAGSNATVQASTVGVNQRVFTVNSTATGTGSGQTNWPLSSITNANHLTNWASVPTNYVPLEAQHATNADFASYATNAGFATNATTATNAMLLSSTGIGLADTNWVLQQISSLGSYVYFGGPTNTFAITNSGETVSRTNVFTGSIAPFVNASTSTISGLTLNAYVRHVISTNTFSQIEAGPVSITTYPFKTGALNPSGHYEFYVVDAASNIMYELASTPTLTIAATVPTEIQSTMLLTNSFVATNLCYVALAFKIDSVGSPGATLSWAHGGSYGAHMTFVRPLSSATINWSQITGTPARSVGISVDGGGSAITAGTKGFIAVPYVGTIQSCTLMASPSGSIEFRLWRTNSADASFPPTAVGAIGTNSLTADNYNVDSTLTGWTTSLAAGDVLAFNIPSAATTITNCTLQLKIQP